MRFYLVALLATGLVLLLTVNKASTEESDQKTTTEPGTNPEANGEAKGEEEGESETEPKEENEGTTKPAENGCDMSLLSALTLTQTVVIARYLM